MKVLLDACVPQWLRQEVTNADVVTAGYAGLANLSDRALLSAIDGRFDVLVTLDRSLSYQQKIAGQRIAVVVIRVNEQTPEAFQAVIPQLNEAISDIALGEVRIVGP